MSRRTSILFQVVLVLIVMILHLYAASSPAASVMNFYKTDDAYYYFIVARNVAAGHGFTFDLINRTNGFHPLWMFINIPIFFFTGEDPILPLRIIIIIMAILTSASGVLIFRLLKKFLNPWLSAAAALTWALLPRIHQVTTEDGLEAGLNAFCLVLMLFAASWFRDRVKEKKAKSSDLIWVGLTASLALFSRLDNIFVVLLVGVWLIMRDLPIQRHLVLDEVFLAVGILGAAIIRLGVNGDYADAMLATYVMLALALILKPIVFSLLNLDMPWNFYGRRFFTLKIILVSGVASLVVGGIMLALSYTGFFSVFPRSFIIYDWIITTVLLIGSRLFFNLSVHVKSGSVFSSWVSWLRENWQRFLKEGFSYFGPMAILMVAYLVWNWTYFGTAMPISGQIKHWWAELPNTVYHHDTTLQVFLGLSPNVDYGPWSILARYPNDYIKDILKGIGVYSLQNFWLAWICLFLLVFILIRKLFKSNGGQSIIKIKDIGIVPLFLGCLLQISYYNATNYPNTRSWYWVGEILFIVLFIAILGDLLISWLMRFKYGKVLSYLALGIVTFLIFKNGITYISKLSPKTVSPDKEEFYLADARGLEQYTPPGSVVGMTGGGTVSYFVEDRTIINLDGLMNSAAYFQGLKEGRGSDFLDAWGVEYIFADEYIVTSSDPYMGLFKDRLSRLGKVRGPENFTLFKYLTSAEMESENP